MLNYNQWPVRATFVLRRVNTWRISREDPEWGCLQACTTYIYFPPPSYLIPNRIWDKLLKCTQFNMVNKIKRWIKMILCKDSKSELRSPNVHHGLLSIFWRWVSDLVLCFWSARSRNKIEYKRYTIPHHSTQVVCCSCI